MNGELWICTLLVAAGILFHFLTKLMELENQGNIVSPFTYWKQHPYTSAIVIVGAYLFMAFQYSIDELSYSAALLTGIASNSAGDKLRARAQAKAEKLTEGVAEKLK